MKNKLSKIFNQDNKTEVTLFVKNTYKKYPVRVGDIIIISGVIFFYAVLPVIFLKNFYRDTERTRVAPFTLLIPYFFSV